LRCLKQTTGLASVFLILNTVTNALQQYLSTVVAAFWKYYLGRSLKEDIVLLLRQLSFITVSYNVLF
jgi:hypothetical protein